jgi:hypothetical protein
MIFAKQIENLFSALARSLSPTKTLNLYLVRHGETEANVDRTLYTTKADHAIRLTSKGISQAEKAGDFLGEMLLEQEERHPLNFGNIRVWHSPYYRARETAYHIWDLWPSVLILRVGHLVIVKIHFYLNKKPVFLMVLVMASLRITIRMKLQIMRNTVNSMGVHMQEHL